MNRLSLVLLTTWRRCADSVIRILRKLIVFSCTSLCRSYINQAHRKILQGFKMFCRSYRGHNKVGSSLMPSFKVVMTKFASLAP